MNNYIYLGEYKNEQEYWELMEQYKREKKLKELINEQQKINE